MAEQTNPWLIEVTEPSATVEPSAGPVGPRRPTTPQAGVVPPERADALPRRHESVYDGDLFVLGVHGGAGESTYTPLIPGAFEARHSWPVPPTGQRTSVLLLCRSSANGLLAAKHAITDWASGSLPGIKLVGLAIVADAPGKLPRPLRDFAHAVGGAVPQVWSLPWSEAVRLGQPLSLDSSKEVRELADYLSAAIYNQNN